MLHLNETLIKRDYAGIAKDFERLALASALTEVMLRLAPEHEPAPGLFRLHANALAWVEEVSHEDLQRLDLVFLNHAMIKTLQLSGSLPQLDCCLSCESALSKWVDSKLDLNAIVARAGWICPNCRESGMGAKTSGEDGAVQGASLKIPAVGLRDVLMSLVAPVRELARSVQGLQIQRADQERVLRWLEAVLLFHAPGAGAPLKTFRFLQRDFPSNIF